jgi:hypothetical protein
MLVEDIGLTIGIVLPYILGLLQCHQAGNRVAIGEILVMLGPAWALDKGNTLNRLAV